MTLRELGLVAAVVMAVGLVVIGCGLAQPTSVPLLPAEASPRPTSTLILPTPAVPAVCRIAGIDKVGEGAFPKWSAANDLVAFTNEVDGQFEVFVMQPDGSDVSCLTCGKAGLADRGHRGQAYWHPSGGYLAFTAENADYPRKGEGTTARPGLGRNHDVWIMTSDGERFWKMTDYPSNWGAIEARFSHDGTKLYWNEEFMMEKYPTGKEEDPVPHPGCYWGIMNLRFRKGEELCAWRVKYADITFGPDGPTIANVRTVNPPDGFTLVEGTGFIPDDRGFIYSYANLAETRGSGLYGELYTSDLGGNSLTRLTSTPLRHNEDAEYSPDGRKIIYKEGTGVPGENMNLYIMDSDGGNKIRLTDFSDPQRAEYVPQALQITEMSWSPDGTQVIYGQVSGLRVEGGNPLIPTGGAHIPSDLYVITLDDGCTK